MISPMSGNPTSSGDASSDQEPIGNADGEEWPNSQAAKPTAHFKPDILESRRAEGKLLEHKFITQVSHFSTALPSLLLRPFHRPFLNASSSGRGLYFDSYSTMRVPCRIHNQ
jgi:hypothetical protein